LQATANVGGAATDTQSLGLIPIYILASICFGAFTAGMLKLTYWVRVMRATCP
jgi:hypothetical protein